MLSRVAENLYWTARYIERAENTARLINVNTHLVLDLPRHITFGWEPLIAITGSETLFGTDEREMDERSVVRFLLGDTRNPGSILSTLDRARENLRTTREHVPREVWELVNDLYLYCRSHLAQGVAKKRRYEFLKYVIGNCQQVAGLLSGTMSRDDTYGFVRLGRNLERADMTTRIVDVRSEDLLQRHADALTPFENIQWMSVLKSLTAYQMYRKHVRVRVRGPDVLKFLLQNHQFPRTLYYCLLEVETCMLNLPRNDNPLRSVTRLERKIQQANVIALASEGLHEFIDDVQVELGALSDNIGDTWFRLDRGL